MCLPVVDVIHDLSEVGPVAGHQWKIGLDMNRCPLSFDFAGVGLQHALEDHIWIDRRDGSLSSANARYFENTFDSLHNVLTVLLKQSQPFCRTLIDVPREFLHQQLGQLFHACTGPLQIVR
jgi:hypothetical protein